MAIDTPLLSVLFEDDDCMVICKPSALTVHPGSGMAPGDKTLLDALIPLFHERSLSMDPSAVLVHRLDRDTTGCLLIAKTRTAHAALQRQFASRTVQKQYLAVVFGIPEHPEAIIDAPVGRHASRRTQMSIIHAVRSRSAQTSYRTLDSSPQAALLLCTPTTGRTHQIRVHLAGIRHPILGDVTYGTDASKELSAQRSIDRYLLHAFSLRFRSCGALRHVVCPPGGAFLVALKRCGLTMPPTVDR